jgi:hypothetical protein
MVHPEGLQPKRQVALRELLAETRRVAAMTAENQHVSPARQPQREVFQTIDNARGVTIVEIAERTGLDLARVRRSVSWLNTHGSITQLGTTRWWYSFDRLVWEIRNDEELSAMFSAEGMRL